MKIAASTEGTRNTVFFAIAVCVLAAFCEGFDLQAAGVAAAGIVSEFKATPAQMGTFFSASTLGLFFGALVGGRLSDSLGRQRLLIISMAVGESAASVPRRIIQAYEGISVIQPRTAGVSASARF